MTQRSSKSVRKEYVAKVILMGVFLGGFALFIGWMVFLGPGLNLFKLSAMDLVLLAFSTYRLGRLIAYDRVMEPLRQFFTNTVPDSTGAGESVDPKGEGFQQALGQLICCPICAGTWVASLLTYGLYLFPGPAHVFLTMTAVIGIAEILGAMTEALSWTGQYARTMSGAKALEKETEKREAALGHSTNTARPIERGQPIERRRIQFQEITSDRRENAAREDAIVDTYQEYR